MSFDCLRNCRHYMLAGLLLLVFQLGSAQKQSAVLDQWLDDHVQELGGRVVLMIYRDGQVVYSQSVNRLTNRQKLGGRMLARKTGKDSKAILKDYDSETKIPIASCSKWLSAALVMTLVDDGSIQLTDSIGSYLPIMTLHGKGKITISDCLSHLTGISSPGIQENRDFLKGENMDEVIQKIADLPMEGEPGKIFHYSSNGLQIAAAIAEKVTGQNFRSLFQERIAIPCGMRSTDFGESKVPLAAGGARSSAADYIRFLSMILQNGLMGQRRILSEQSIDLMQRNHAARATYAYAPAEAGHWGYGYGEWVMDNVNEHTRSAAVTSPGLFGSFPWINNEKKYAAVLFTFNLKNKGRGEHYRGLKKLVDEWMENE